MHEAYAIDQRVVDLYVESEALGLQTFDQRAFPQRARALERQRVQA